MSKILLVEDDNNLREIFEMRLTAEGYQTVTASNGEEGLTVAMKEKPDLIIADVMMPKLSGFEMLETLRASPEMKNTKAVMMTALGQAEDQARGEKAGVVKYLVKSQVTLEDFVRVVREVLPPSSNDPQSNNKQGREDPMPEDNQSTNPDPAAMPPASDPAAGAANPITNEPAAPAGSDAPMTTAQQQDTVNSQISDFAASTPAADTSMPAAGDTPAPSATDSAMPAAQESTSVPVSTPPADDSSAAPEAPADPSTPPSAPTETPGGTV